MNLQTQKRSLHVGRQHYDRGNDLFQIMLDSNMNYTCGYWRKAENLEQAQLDKLYLTCRKLCLKPGMKLLDIGCGWEDLQNMLLKTMGYQ
ncbi:class I SAM-dependent methyltransferase [Legionella pneumophila]|nr:class I SAM-dependent methyltransferase [Legionella pneumophila]